MPSTIFYSSLGAEILRIARANNDVTTFFNSMKVIITRIIKQGGKAYNIMKILKKIYGRHFLIFSKFAPTCKIFIDRAF